MSRSAAAVPQGASSSSSSGVLSYAASAGSSVASYLSPLLSSSIHKAGGALSSSSGQSSASGAADIGSNRDMDRFYHVKVRPLLDAVDQLRGLLVAEPIRLPTIVVVGDQSSGKSSVLEALSGVSLPRGQNITTRCPLILRLINLTPDSTAVVSSSSSSSSASSASAQSSSAVAHPVLSNGHAHHGSGSAAREKASAGADASSDAPSLSSSSSSSSDALPRPYAVLSLSPLPSAKDARLTNLDDIGPAITALTARIAGHHQSISATPLYLSVYRAQSPDLTLVDLPGITRNPIGDQPRDIYAQIKALIMRYIEPSESVILNVMPASVDMPTCECVMLSKDVDPEGARSIGVVTKIDLAEKGVRRKLEKGVDELGLQMGVVAVRCRSQEENDRGVSWEVSREMERQFFRQHPELSALADDSHGSLQLGVPALAALLTSIQEQKIRQSLPGIRSNIRDSLLSQRSLLVALPPTLTSYSDAKGKVDLLLSHFLANVAALARGDHSIARGDTKLHLSPRLSELYALYAATLSSNFSSFLTLDYARVVQEEIKENTGVSLPNFLSHQVFEGLMRREMRKVAVPSKQLVEGVRALLSSVLGTVLRDSFAGYGGLAVRLTSMVNAFLDERQRVILERVDELLAEEEELYTQNAAYMDVVMKLKAALYERLYGGTQKDREDRERVQERKERERTTPAGAAAQAVSHGKGWLTSALSSAVPQQLGGGGAITANGGASASSASSSSATFAINELTVTVDVAALTLPMSASVSAFNAHTAAAASQSSTLANMLPANIILDMQINLYSYSVIACKRLSDALPLLLRFHFVKGVAAALSQRLHRDVADMGEKALVDLMREDKDVSAKRERLQASVSRLDKALQVLESL